ncbi:sensor histidine kinase [Paraburkholderia sp. BL21I4N1]|uniref:sensor histidine kinase n=1 Tax=Paraburkholderia sp. BL21I4N1 TaxID=1938801 RepID=UPI000CFD14D0|nr:sensor histidine kinase [Paraburkholderia sp. BL21I4N1]PQV54435.1 histidine kinase [Paraburkholderia sp. BL21I4N1]
MTNSLRLRLLLWLLLPMTVYVIAAGLIAHDNAARTARLLQDEALLSSARVMAGDIEWKNGYLHAEISPSAIEILSSPAGDRVYFSIREAGGATIAGTSDFPQRVPDESPLWYDATVGGHPIRAVSLIRPMYDAGAVKQVVVSVGRTLLQRDATAAALWQPQMLHFASIVGIAVVLVCVGLTFELRPLMRLANDMLARAPNASLRVRADPLRNELRPIVSAFNQCLDIIERKTAMQRRFIADAAHQLRTPLTLLGTQLQYARRQDDLAQIKETLLAMHRSNHSLVALTNQLLLLAQAEAADYADFQGVPVDLRAVATATIEQLALLAQRRGVELSARLDEDAEVMGNEPLLSVLLFNLLDNAIRYTPADGHVALDLAAHEGRWVVTVTDEGPGIDVALRERVFEPFFRASGEEGSGLGLAIVREIARAHRAEVRLEDGVDGRGLRASVVFPASGK